MRIFMSLVFSSLLLATVIGLAVPEGLSQGLHADAVQTVPLLQDSMCGEGSGHGTCQLVAGGPPVLFGLRVDIESSHYEIKPEVADGRSLAPHTPPPRHAV
ncbi:MAG: hypothetical protein V4753_00215 [Pseudomonadota bacterium]